MHCGQGIIITVPEESSHMHAQVNTLDTIAAHPPATNPCHSGCFAFSEPMIRRMPRLVTSPHLVRKQQVQQANALLRRMPSIKG